MNTHKYDLEFFDYTDRVATRSARIVLPIVREYFPVRSVADFGCGRGAWLAMWKQLGATEVLGIDGSYVDPQDLLIDREEFFAADLCEMEGLERKFDLVQSLEVAEHLPGHCAERFVQTLTSCTNVVLFSAAPPGQGGMHHVNERPYSYWRNIFAAHNFVMLDLVRPMIQNAREVLPWYRYNTFVFVDKSMLEGLSAEVAQHLLDGNCLVPDFSPWTYKIRKAILRFLPVFIVDRLSQLQMSWSRSRQTALRS